MSLKTFMLLTIILLAFFCFELSVAVNRTDPLRKIKVTDPAVIEAATFALVQGRSFQFGGVLDAHFREDHFGQHYTLTIELVDRGSIHNYNAIVFVTGLNKRKLDMFEQIHDHRSSRVGPNNGDDLRNDPLVIEVAKWAVAHGAKLHFKRVTSADVQTGMGRALHYTMGIMASNYKHELRKYVAKVTEEGDQKLLNEFYERPGLIRTNDLT